MRHRVRLVRRPAVLTLVVTTAVLAGVGLALLQPWQLWVDTTVNEAAPAGPAAPARRPPVGLPDSSVPSGTSRPPATPPAR
jgi:hypothetical protein